MIILKVKTMCAANLETKIGTFLICRLSVVIVHLKHFFSLIQGYSVFQILGNETTVTLMELILFFGRYFLLFFVLHSHSWKRFLKPVGFTSSSLAFARFTCVPIGASKVSWKLYDFYCFAVST